MYRLPNTLVNPSSTKIRFFTRFLRGDNVYGRTEGKNQWVEYDVLTGMMRPIESTELSAMLKQDEYFTHLTKGPEEVRRLSSLAKTDMPTSSVMAKLQAYREVSDPDDSVRYALDLPLMEGNGLRFLVALVNQQVKADDLIKGLRALGIQPGFRLQQNFLGGWNISAIGIVVSVEDICKDIEEQRAE